jgi:hypothetical protein
MAVGVSGWGLSKAPRAGRAARVEAHAEVQRAEAVLASQQQALRLALASASADCEAILSAMHQAEDVLVDARKQWAMAAGLAVAGEPVRPARSEVPAPRRITWAQPALPAARGNVVLGAWV